MSAAEDLAEINHLLAEYCLAADQGRFADWAGCYAPDGEMHAFRKVWKGPSELEAFIADAPQGIHICGLPRIELHGERADAALNFVFLNREKQIFSMGFYTDELVRGADGWRIRCRKIELLKAAR